MPCYETRANVDLRLRWYCATSRSLRRDDSSGSKYPPYDVIHADTSIMPSKANVRLKPKTSKRTVKSTPAKRKAGPAKSGSALGGLPEWNLADLYAGLDDPAIRRDLDRIDAECVAFEDAFKGKLAELAQGAGAGSALVEVVQRYEAIDDLMGR